MKKILILMASLILMVTLTACGGDEAPEEKGFDPITVADSIVAGEYFSDDLQPIEDNVVADMYGIDFEMVASSKVYFGTNATPEEVAVFTAVDAASAETIKEAVLQRVSDQITAFRDYMPDQVIKLENAIVLTSENNVILCVADDKDAAESAINSILEI